MRGEQCPSRISWDENLHGGNRGNGTGRGPAMPLFYLCRQPYPQATHFPTPRAAEKPARPTDGKNTKNILKVPSDRLKVTINSVESRY